MNGDRAETVSLATNGTARRAAAAAWQESAAAGVPLSGAQLGERFGRSPRWGRQVIAVARSVDPAAIPAAKMPEVAAAPERHEDGMPAHPAASPRRPWQDSAITLAVALVAAAASYGHMYDVASMAGEPVWIARAWPVTVDGLAYAAMRRGEAGRGWLALSLAVSVAANVVAQFPEWAVMAGPVVSAWPPLALYGTHRLLTRRSYHPEPALQVLG